MFAQKTALITGGGSGIGRAMGVELAARGARVVFADIDGDAARAAASEVGVDASGHALDVTDDTAVRELVDGLPALDFMFNNAGISMGGPTHEFGIAHWDRMIDVNLRGVVNGVVAAYPRMVDQGHGHIVNTASGAGLVSPPLVAAYAATKHAVVGLSTALRSEAALHGVRVSVVCPGAVDTAILDRLPPPDLPTQASQPVTPRDYLATIGQKPISASRFARLALDQVERNRGIIVVPRSAKAFWYLHRLSPRVTDRIARSLARKVHRDLVRPAS